jgi:hypothetical protein
MKCISLWQPWASLMAMGQKRIETRSWPTAYRGPLAIHAAKTWNREIAAMVAVEPFRSVLGVNWHDTAFHKDGKTTVLPRGAIIAVVDLVDCREITEKNAVSGNERAFGDYTPGRFGWITKNLRVLPAPVPFKGAQGLFEVPDELVGPWWRPVVVEGGGA